MSLKVFITGGTTGIGLALAKKYLEQGALVAICGRNLSKLEFTHPNLVAYEIDVTDRERLKQKTEEFAQGRLDIFIANAGIAIANKKSIPDFALAHQVIDINVHGVLNSFEAALNIMLAQQRGQIVVIASVAGMVGLPGAAAYCASKAAVLKLCESYQLDLRKQNIDVTTIAPGFIATPLTDKNFHKMPWLMSADRAAELIMTAITKRKPLYVFPWQMKIVITILSIIPRVFYRWLMQLSIINYNKNN